MKLDAIIIPSGRKELNNDDVIAELPATRKIFIGRNTLDRYEINLTVPVPLPGDELRTGNNIAFRRKIGIHTAYIYGARTALLLDDDIHITPEDLAWGLDMISRGAEAAAYRVVDCPDNSTVFHAWRTTGWEPGVQPSGAALMINVDAAVRESWRWANIYNEDWLFMSGLRVATGGPYVSQVEYDPFVPLRAASQESGEILAEGLLMGNGLETSFWEWQITRRRDFLEYLLGLTMPGEAKASLGEALDMNKQCTGEMFSAWVRTWRNRKILTERYHSCFPDAP